MIDKAKPCPICGKRPNIVRRVTDVDNEQSQCFCFCDDCGLFSRPAWKDEKQAVSLWNKLANLISGTAYYKRGKSERNITRYDGTTSSFKGWRLAIAKNCSLFTRYFSDSKYGSEQNALAEAVKLRDEVLAELTTANCKVVFEKYKKKEEQ